MRTVGEDDQPEAHDGAGMTLKLTIPMVPPGVNHYVRHTRNGRHYVSKQAEAFKEAVFLATERKFVVATGQDPAFQVDAWVYLGKGQRADVDGFGKLILDGLAYAQVFQHKRPNWACMVPLTDSYVTDFNIRKRRDAENPRTEITVKAI